jgi:hypothetical protein
LGISVPSEEAAKDSNPRSMPIAAPAAGKGGFRIQPKRPLAALPFDCDGFDRSLYRAMQLDFHLTNSLNIGPIAVETAAVTITRGGHAVEMPSRLESGISHFFVAFDSTKESIETNAGSSLGL